MPEHERRRWLPPGVAGPSLVLALIFGSVGLALGGLYGALTGVLIAGLLFWVDRVTWLRHLATETQQRGCTSVAIEAAVISNRLHN